MKQKINEQISLINTIRELWKSVSDLPLGFSGIGGTYDLIYIYAFLYRDKKQPIRGAMAVKTESDGVTFCKGSIVGDGIIPDNPIVWEKWDSTDSKNKGKTVFYKKYFDATKRIEAGLNKGACNATLMEKCNRIYDILEELKLTNINFIQNEIKKIDINTEIKNKPQQYQLDVAKTEKVYKFCIENNIISDSISELNFLNDISNADLKGIFANAEQQKSKSKCRYIIYVLSAHLGTEWYLEAARSINTEPNKCSGANVPFKWRRQADELK